MTAQPAFYLALDPGGSTGWASFDEKGNGVSMGTCGRRDQIYSLLKEVKPSLIIIEDWITKQNANLGGDRLETVRIIGAVEFYAYIRQIPIHFQPNTVKPIAYKWAGIGHLYKSGAKNKSHEKDAYAHGVYWLIKNGRRQHQQGVAK